MIRFFRRLLFLLVFFVFFSSSCFAKWSTPIAVINGTWGRGDDQFGFNEQYLADKLPRTFKVHANGNIVIADIVNKRVKVYNSNGLIVSNLSSKYDFIEEWPSSNYLINAYGLIVDLGGGNYEYQDFSSAEINTFNIQNTRLLSTSGDSNFFLEAYDGKYIEIDKYGTVIKEFNSRPKELLNIVENLNDNEKFEYEISLGESTYFIGNINLPLEEIYLDNEGHVLAVSSNVDTTSKNIIPELEGGTPSTLDINYFVVFLFSGCGTYLGEIKLPYSNSGYVFIDGKLKHDSSLEVEYGPPVIGPNGDVYAWKRTPDTYSILKWEWGDDPSDPKGGPEPPTNLTVQPSLDGMLVSWGASPQDPGCVDGYEIESATSSGGIYSLTGSTPAGTLKYNDTKPLPGDTYFYKVRAKAGGEYSDYTTVTSGTRP